MLQKDNLKQDLRKNCEIQAKTNKKLINQNEGSHFIAKALLSIFQSNSLLDLFFICLVIQTSLGLQTVQYKLLQSLEASTHAVGKFSQYGDIMINARGGEYVYQLWWTFTSSYQQKASIQYYGRSYYSGKLIFSFGESGRTFYLLNQQSVQRFQYESSSYKSKQYYYKYQFTWIRDAIINNGFQQVILASMPIRVWRKNPSNNYWIDNSYSAYQYDALSIKASSNATVIVCCNSTSVSISKRYQNQNNLYYLIVQLISLEDQYNQYCAIDITHNASLIAYSDNSAVKIIQHQPQNDNLRAMQSMLFYNNTNLTSNMTDNVKGNYKEVYQLPYFDDAVRNISWSANGERLLVASRTNINVYQKFSNDYVLIFNHIVLNEDISVSLSPDGQRLLLCWPTTNRNCEVWSCDLSYLVFGLIWVGIVIGISLLLGTISYCILKYQRTQRKHQGKPVKHAQTTGSEILSLFSADQT